MIAEAKVLVPPSGFGGTPMRFKNPGVLSEPLPPKLMHNAVDVSTRRNELPCKGITHSVLRTQPPNSAAGMLAPTGIGRHQPPGLSQQRPTDLPILKLSDPFASGMNSRLGQPK